MKKIKRVYIENMLCGDKPIIIRVVDFLMSIGYDPKTTYSQEELEEFENDVIFNIRMPLQFKPKGCYGPGYERKRMQALIKDMLV